MTNENLAQLQSRFNQNPGSEVFYELGCAYIDCGLLEAGAEVLQKGLRFHPDHEHAYAALGMLKYRAGDIDEARDMLHKALSLNAQCPQALASLAEIEIDSGNLQRAENYLIQVDTCEYGLDLDDLWKRLESKRIDTLNNPSVDMPLVSESMVTLYLQQGLDEKALAALKQLVVKYPHKMDLQRKLESIELKLQQKSLVCSPSGEEVQQVFNTWLDNIARRKREICDV